VDLLSDIFLRFLDFSHQFTRNYGWDIILLTFIIRLILLPLTFSGLRGMKAMQQAQPRVKELQTKYRDDKEKLNKELMALYKEVGFNPISGCLPMVLQIPIFIMLYQVLRLPEKNGFILVNESFYGLDLTTAAITKLSNDFLANLHTVMPGMIDLSFLGIGFLRDTYLYAPALILVAVMAVTTIMQQKMMTIDPSQKTTMIMMNLMIIYFAFLMPTGVLLYWGVSNLLQFAQQAVTRTPAKNVTDTKKASEKAKTSRSDKKTDSPPDSIKKEKSGDGDSKKSSPAKTASASKTAEPKSGGSQKKNYPAQKSGGSKKSKKRKKR